MDDVDAISCPATTRTPNGFQLAQLRYVTSSEAAARSLAESYIGFPFD